MINHIYTNAIWFSLVALTVASYLLGEIGEGGLGTAIFLLIAAFIKGYLIISEFMEVRGVALIWRFLMYGWLFSVCLVILTAYIISL
jgi:cytochrome c oxidase subunit IV